MHEPSMCRIMSIVFHAPQHMPCMQTVHILEGNLYVKHS